VPALTKWILLSRLHSVVARAGNARNQNGASGVAVTLSYDAGLLAYKATLTLDSNLPPKGNILVTQTDLVLNVVEYRCIVRHRAGCFSAGCYRPVGR